MTTTFRRAGGLLLGAVLLAGAAPAQTFNNLYYMRGLKNELTSVKPAFDGGYFASANFPDGAALLKLKANGDLEWARHYGGPTPPQQTPSLQAVKLHMGNPTIAWTGNDTGGNQTVPVIVLTDFNGNIQKKSRIDLGMNAEAKAVDFDDVSFWVGGTGWPASGGSDPWVARIHYTSGAALWVQSFHFSFPCQLDSLAVSDSGGVVGVGQALVDVQGTARQRMFAFKLNAAGNLQWAFRYDVDKVDLSASNQWLADISNAGTNLHVAGVITDLCTDPLSPTCVPRPRSILTATIDEASGALQKAWAVYDQNGRPLWAYTIAGPENQIAIGGKVETSPSDSEALLLSGTFDQQVSSLQGKLYGDGPGPFPSQVEDVAWTGSGFVFVTQQRHNSFRPAIVRTDQNLSAGPPGQSCEHGISLQAASVSTLPTKLRFHSNPRRLGRIKIPESRIEPTQRPCTELVP